MAMVFRLKILQQLAESLDAFGNKWEYNYGDGAFYGPKVNMFFVNLWMQLTSNQSLLFIILKK